MVWFIAIAIIGYILYSFFNDLNKDNYDLQSQSLEEKFKFIVSRLNEVAFNGKGNVTNLDKRSFNLYESDSNQIINFTYSTGHLTLTWKYKYFQKEVVHEKVFRETRNLSLFEQQKIADIMISEMELKIENHKLAVIRGI